jgi:hypothetical protein
LFPDRPEVVVSVELWASDVVDVVMRVDRVIELSEIDVAVTVDEGSGSEDVVAEVKT